MEASHALSPKLARREEGEKKGGGKSNDNKNKKSKNKSNDDNNRDSNNTSNMRKHRCRRDIGIKRKGCISTPPKMPPRARYILE